MTSVYARDANSTLYVEAPEDYRGHGDPRVRVFLAGGITDCPDWQAAIRSLLPPGIVIFNPRRENFPIHDPRAARGQIEWEYRHLERADVIVFYFPESTSPQPIALYELGKHLHGNIVVGTDLHYSRRMDVAIQLALARPGLTVWSSLGGLAAAAEEVIEAEAHKRRGEA